MASIFYPSLMGNLISSQNARQEWVAKLSNDFLALALKACGSGTAMLEDGSHRKMSERILLDLLEEAPGEKFHLIGSYILANPAERACCIERALRVSAFSDASGVITVSPQVAEKHVTGMVVDVGSCTGDKEVLPSLDTGKEAIWPPLRVCFRERMQVSLLGYTENVSGGLKGWGKGKTAGGDANLVSNLVHEKFKRRKRSGHPSSPLVEGSKVGTLQRCDSQVGNRRVLLFSAIGMLMSVLFLAWLLQEYESVQKKEEFLYEAGGEEKNLENSLD